MIGGLNQPRPLMSGLSQIEMKKAILLVLAAMLTSLVIACGDDTDNNTDTSQDSTDSAVQDAGPDAAV